MKIPDMWNKSDDFRSGIPGLSGMGPQQKGYSKN